MRTGSAPSTSTGSAPMSAASSPASPPTSRPCRPTSTRSARQRPSRRSCWARCTASWCSSTPPSPHARRRRQGWPQPSLSTSRSSRRTRPLNETSRRRSPVCRRRRPPLSQGFGCTPYMFEPYDPNCPNRHFHSGLDISDPCGTAIHAADSGIVNTYYSSYGYGNHILIDHGHGWVSLYGHMSSFVVGNGQTVHRGQLIGYEGTTGNSTGCHLHFEVDLNNNPQNPLAYLS